MYIYVYVLSLSLSLSEQNLALWSDDKINDNLTLRSDDKINNNLALRSDDKISLFGVMIRTNYNLFVLFTCSVLTFDRIYS